MSSKFKKKLAGFTLVEVLVVVIIVAILAAISVPLYLKYVEDARAAEARAAISSIWTGCKVWHQRYGVWEKDWKKYKIQIDEATLQHWDFDILGSPPTMIVSTSSSKMPGGAGKQVTYHIETGEFTGYGE